MRTAAKRLDAIIYAELNRRRASGDLGDDLLGLLLETRDGDDLLLTDRNIRDEVMTLLFAGHDTTTSTVVFLFHELARHPHLVEAEDFSLEQALDETLRLYPPAWIGPRRSIEPAEIAGVTVPGGVPVEYSSWASHHLPDVWEDPQRLQARALRPREPRADPQGRLRPLRRRLAHLHRHALRPGRDQRHRRQDPAALPPRPRSPATSCASARRRRSAPATACPSPSARRSPPSGLGDGTSREPLAA